MVLSRALSLAAVTLLVGCCAMGQVEAQENLDAGKSPSQLFSGTCTACHKSARGLLKTVAPGSLQAFLRQHYTTSPEMAGVLTSYLMSNGATDTRYGDKQRGARDGKAGREAKFEAKPTGEPGASETQGEHERHGRGTGRLVRPAQAPEGATEGAKEDSKSEATEPSAEGQAPQAIAGHGPEGRKARRLSKRGKPGLEQEVPKAAEKAAEPANKEGVETPKGDTAKVEPAKPEAAKPEETSKPVEGAKPAESPAQSANANAEPTKEKVNEALPPSLRPNPVPSVTPASPASASSGGASSAESAPAAAPEPSVSR